MSRFTLPARSDLPLYFPAAACLLLGVSTAAGDRGPTPFALGAGGVGLTLLWLAWRYPAQTPVAHAGAATLAIVTLLLPGAPTLPILITALICIAALLAQYQGAERRAVAVEAERQILARQVDRRINEIFSLQELSYVLAESLQSERIASQVARYVMRFLNAEGAAVALMRESDGVLRIAAAEGVLAPALGASVPDTPPSLVVRAITTERIEVSGSSEDTPALLLPGHQAASGAAAPLRAHGLTMGVLAVADRRQGGYSTEDLWLLSTVATHVAVVLANSRLFEMVRQAKDEWETAFNALTEGIAVLDASGKISRGNAALARLLDVPAPALLGQPFWATIIGTAEGEGRLIDAARRGERPPSLTLPSTTTQRILRLTAAPMSAAQDGAAVVVLVEDVTEQRALESQLIQSEKLAAVGQLVSGVAHEINNPLTSIAGLAEFLQERVGPTSAEAEHLRVIHEQAERAGRIVRNLLTFARKTAPGDALVDLNDTVGRSALLVGYELHLHGIELVQDRMDEPLLVRGSGDELQQVLLNLITNAGHALRSLPPGRRRRVTLTSAREGGRVAVRVRDTGPGVPSDLVPKLFTPFFTTKEPGEGTGLGLSLSFRIVESHGGRLAYQPVAGGGAEFWFALPLATEELAAVRAPASVPSGIRAVLVLDNDPGTELVVRALFEPAGYLVEVARAGGDIAGRLAARAWRLLVVEGGLSADGKALLADQLTSQADQRVIITTADPLLAARCRARGLMIVSRPFLPRDLVEVAGDLIIPEPGSGPQGEVAR